MSTQNVNLTEHFSEFVQAQVASGEFHDASEVLHAGLRLLEQQINEDREKLELLKSLANEGFRQLDQGEGIQFNSRDELREHLHGLRLAAQERCNKE